MSKNLISQKEKNETAKRVKEIIEDYESRASIRRAYDEAWLLNINFLLGNQYAFIAPNGEISETEKLYPYESREVFNHIAPIVESRLAKLGKVRPSVAVMPSSNSEKDKEIAKTSKMVLNSKLSELNISEVLKRGTLWSEVLGTAIYKITNNSVSGVSVDVVSPFEIFPEDSSLEEISDNPSIIHAKCLDKKAAEETYNLSDLKGEDIASLSLGGFVGDSFMVNRYSKKTAQVVKHDQVLVIERYIRPDKTNKNGKLEIVVGEHLVYDGELPTGEYPFVKQVSNSLVGNFWGQSVVERCIPLQRTYNAVKNRKIEFLSRLTSGVLAVEEGSVDLDLLENEGLAPGKILVYRSGCSAPKFMDGFSLPSELNREEDRLVSEMNALGGVSELMRNTLLPTNVTSGTAINQLTEADDTRLSVSAEHIRGALLEMSKMILRIMKKYTTGEKLSRLFDDHGEVEAFYWKSSDLKTDDIVLDTVNELSDSLSSRRQNAMELFRAGLFSDENGNLDSYAKTKILDILGFGNFESGQDITQSHILRAKRENLDAESKVVLEVDDHDVHIKEHTRYLIDNPEIKKEKFDELMEHIRAHKSFKKAGQILSESGR